MGVSGIMVSQYAKEATISAVITRADGTIEDLNVISYYHRNPVKRTFWNIMEFLKFKKREK